MHKILVANRGEIAVRILRTVRSLGYRSAAVYSAADADAPHVALADDAVLLGAPPVAESYLSVERILAAARRVGADALHPGYGFLSENAAFARACAEAGLIFIGPTPEAIDLMGNKAAAKRHMIAAGVPCVPGYQGRDQSDAELVGAAAAIGYPVMVKAAAGGGGRGMRLTTSREDLERALPLARAEAENAFGSAELILEKAIARPRHVEIQVFADRDGNTIHLGERDCSVQRRHQKVIEEAPCPIMSEELRLRMGGAAVDAARSIGYQGAGTVEFLVDEARSFYFLEMNTRLQVEHPVTEMVTGLDLVALQIQVAEGRPLGIEQSDVRLTGHAIEARLYAEDPAQGFLPCTGRVESWRPALGSGIRVDSGIETGQEISPFYDPMVAKVIAFGATRDIARRRLIAALADSVLFGPKTNRAFLIDCLSDDTFAEGGATTAFIEVELASTALAEPVPTPAQVSAVAVLQYVSQRQAAHRRSVRVGAPLLNWSTTGTMHSEFRYVVAGARFAVRVTPLSRSSYSVSCGVSEVTIAVVDIDHESAQLRIGGQAQRVHFQRRGVGELWASIDGRTFLLRDSLALVGADEEGVGGGSVRAPMHGVVREVFVAVGDSVRVGDRLAILEAMKMQHELSAGVAGVVREVRAETGRQVAAGTVLIEIEVVEDSPSATAAANAPSR